MNPSRISGHEFYDALLILEPKLNQKELDFLTAHYYAPNQTATATQLAHAVGFRGYRATNLRYGRLAGKLCDLFRVELRTKLSILVTFDQPPGSDAQLTMRPNVALALEQLGWCNNRSLPAPESYDAYTALADSESGETVQERVILSRLRQGSFRASVIRYWQKCAVTGCSHVSVLKASHIKPWSKSTNKERLDPANGLLLTPNLDAAFDQGLITFGDDGKIQLSVKANRNDLHLLGINEDMHIGRLTQRHTTYLNYHRKNVFSK